MNFSSKLFSKRVTNLIVSKNCFTVNCFDVNKTFGVKKHLNFAIKCSQNHWENLTNFCGTSYPKIRCYSSKTNSSEEQEKCLPNDKEVLENEFLSEGESKPDLKESTKTKFKKYSDEDSEVIYDVSEELLSTKQENRPHFVDKEWKESDEELYLYQQKPKQKTKLVDKQFIRGKTGVFDIHELVELLREENIKEIAVIEVPKEMDYCQYLVLGNATSKRHLNAFSEYFNKVYKMKKSGKDPFLDFGGQNSTDWKVVDMKNIVLHLFLKPTRDHYDIETLWTVGYEFDDKVQRPDIDNVVDIMEKHIKFLEEIKPKN